MSKIRISHDLNDLSAKPERILVMKDKSILEESDSDNDAVEIEDVEMRETEKLESNKRRGKHGKKFNPYEDDWDAEQQGETLLSKYDDFDQLEAERKRAKTTELTIGASVSSRAAARSADKSEQYSAADEMPSTMTIGSMPSRTVPRPSQFPAGLSVEEKLRFQSDFLSSAEAATFKKVTARKKRNRKTSDHEEDEQTIIKFEPVRHGADEDEELYAQLARMRRMEKVQIRDDNFIAEAVRSTRDADVDSAAQAPGGAVLDFISRIQPGKAESEDDADRRPGPAKPERTESPEPEPMDELVSSSKPETAAAAEFTTDVKVDSGLACALKFFQSRGVMEESTTAPGEVHLEHRDEFGRAIDAKEAYKQLSWRFHGVKPSAAKQEKRLRKIDNEIKAQIADSSGSITMRAMDKVKSQGMSHLSLGKQ